MIFNIAGRRVGLDMAGEGVPMVFLHGFPHDRTLWSHQVSALSLKARCIAPDLRGFGESDVQGPYAMEQYAHDVRALLDHFDIERAAIVGLSMGGYIAMACWRAMPDRVMGLALLDTQMGADDDAGRAKREALMAKVRSEGAEAAVQAQLPGMVGKTTRAQRPDLVEKMAQMMRSAPVEGIVGALTAMRDRPDSSGTIGTVSVPTLVAVGDEDVLTPVAKAEQIAAALPPGTVRRLEVIAGSGHVSCVERPSAVNHALSEFLDAVQSF